MKARHSLAVFLLLLSSFVSVSAHAAPAVSTSNQHEVEVLRGDIRSLNRELSEEVRASKMKGDGPASDAVVAARALKIEEVLTKQKRLMELRRESASKTSEVQGAALRAQLAAATSVEERNAILLNQQVLNRAIRFDEGAQK